MPDFDLNFTEFLEARYGNVGGAFGKQAKSAFDDGNDNYDARIQAGRALELQIRDRLAEYGVMTAPSSRGSDQNYGIDGYITSVDGGKTKKSPQTSFQIKARKVSSGNDILWETIKPWNDRIKTNFEELGDAAFTGKDMRCKAELLISLGNNGGIIRIRRVAEALDIARKMTKELMQVLRATGTPTCRTRWGEARLTIDPSRQATAGIYGSKIEKINCFISPGAFEWKQDVQLKTPITAS
jgi:hypothetical protein